MKILGQICTYYHTYVAMLAKKFQDYSRNLGKEGALKFNWCICAKSLQ